MKKYICFLNIFKKKVYVIKFDYRDSFQNTEFELGSNPKLDVGSSIHFPSDYSAGACGKNRWTKLVASNLAEDK